MKMRMKLRKKKRPRPFITENVQAFSFTRRAIVLGVGQGALATALGVRMGWLAIAENAHYKLLAESTGCRSG